MLSRIVSRSGFKVRTARSVIERLVRCLNLDREIVYRNQMQAGLGHKQCRMSTEKLVNPFPFWPQRSLGLLLSNQLSEIQVADTGM